MKIKRNITALRKGVDNIEKLQKDIIDEKQEKKNKKFENILGIFGILAVISIICDFLQVVDWYTKISNEFWQKLITGTLAKNDIVYVLLSVLVPLAMIGLVGYAIYAFIKINSKK